MKVAREAQSVSFASERDEILATHAGWVVTHHAGLHWGIPMQHFPCGTPISKLPLTKANLRLWKNLNQVGPAPVDPAQ